MRLKSNSVAEFTQRLENDILPLLRKQKGFQDEITFVTQGGREAFGISLWDKAENAEAYNRETYPEVAKFLATVVEGAPLRLKLMMSRTRRSTRSRQRSLPDEYDFTH